MARPCAPPAPRHLRYAGRIGTYTGAGNRGADGWVKGWGKAACCPSRLVGDRQLAAGPSTDAGWNGQAGVRRRLPARSDSSQAAARIAARRRHFRLRSHHPALRPHVIPAANPTVDTASAVMGRGLCLSTHSRVRHAPEEPDAVGNGRARDGDNWYRQ